MPARDDRVRARQSPVWPGSPVRKLTVEHAVSVRRNRRDARARRSRRSRPPCGSAPPRSGSTRCWGCGRRTTPPTRRRRPCTRTTGRATPRAPEGRPARRRHCRARTAGSPPTRAGRRQAERSAGRRAPGSLSRTSRCPSSSDAVARTHLPVPSITSNGLAICSPRTRRWMTRAKAVGGALPPKPRRAPPSDVAWTRERTGS